MFFVAALPFFFYSCDLLEPVGVSEEEVVQGLKTALEIGTDTSCSTLNKEDGYYGEEILRILLPPEADPILEAIDLLEGTLLGDAIKKELDKQKDTLILAINRSAEDAAEEAKPIFVNAITNMTIYEGMDILMGTNFKDTTVNDFDSLAATHYLDLKTRADLTTAFSPYIDSSLNKDLGLGFSANQAWETLVAYYNAYAYPIIVNSSNPNAVQIDENVTLGEHSTLKALDGLFLLVGNEEKKIRKDPYQWADEIIQKVFGSVYEE